MSTNNLSAAGPPGTIPVPDAVRMANNWKVYLDKSAQAFITESFLVPIVAFQNILLYNPTAEGVRVYIGLEDSEDPNSAKLILVPVVDGKEVPYLPEPKTEGTVGGDGSSNTYDMTHPCPPECGGPESIFRS